MPESYKETKELFDAYPPASLKTVFERLMVCHHPQLKEGNKQRLLKLFLYLLRYYNHVTENLSEQNVTVTRALSQMLFTLLKVSQLLYRWWGNGLPIAAERGLRRALYAR